MKDSDIISGLPGREGRTGKEGRQAVDFSKLFFYNKVIKGSEEVHWRMKRFFAALAAFVLLLCVLSSAAEEGGYDGQDDAEDLDSPGAAVPEGAFAYGSYGGGEDEGEPEPDEYYDDEAELDDYYDSEPVLDMTEQETESAKETLNQYAGYHDDGWKSDEALHMTYVGLPDGVSCKTLLYSGYDADLVIPEKIGGLTVRVIGNSTFSGRENLKSVVLPDTVELIEERAFFGCVNLRSITMQEGVLMLERASFGACTALEEILIPQSVEYVGEFAFLKCPLLSELTFGENLREIGPNAFYLCESLKKVTIPRKTELDEASWEGVPEDMEIAYLD